MKRDSTVIKVGDKVQIINPVIITRIGYDFTYEDACKEVLENYTEDISTLLRKTGFKFKLMNNYAWEKAEKKIVGAIAYNLVGTKIKTGNERKLYTEINENLRDVIVTVTAKKNVKTGIYYPAVCSEPTSFGGDYDYDPGGLKDPKTHVVLTINTGNRYTEYDILIEQSNVKKI